MDRQGNRRLPRVRLALWFAVLLPGLVWLVPAVAEVHYTLTLSEDLAVVDVEVRLPGEHRPLSAPDGRVDELRSLTSCEGERLSTRDGRIQTRGSNGCLQYRYPLRAQSGRRSPPVAEGMRVVTPGKWLWTPELVPGERLLVAVNAPEEMALSVPWTPLGPDRFELRPSPGSATGTAVIGRFGHSTLSVDAAALRVAMLDGPDLRLDEASVLEWLRVAAADVASVGSRFPNPHLQVMVQPVRSRGQSPVPFGYVIRDGGEAVRFYVDPNRPLSEFHADWTATHEFAHLLLPYVRSREKWVSEGFASYYQNVLLARRGAYGTADAWARLIRSFQRAAQVSDPPALDRLHERAFRDVRMLVYWSGAAFALMADVRLRAQSGGSESLDSALASLARCCLPSESTWTAVELFSRLDDFVIKPVFVPLYDEFMARRGMPELGELYRDLGIENGADGLALLAEGRLVPVRDAIMRPTRD